MVNDTRRSVSRYWISYTFSSVLIIFFEESSINRVTNRREKTRIGKKNYES